MRLLSAKWMKLSEPAAGHELGFGRHTVPNHRGSLCTSTVMGNRKLRDALYPEDLLPILFGDDGPSTQTLEPNRRARRSTNKRFPMSIFSPSSMARIGASHR